MNSRFNLLFIISVFSLSLTLMACPHPDNKTPENVIRNDDFTKMGGHGYNPNTVKPTLPGGGEAAAPAAAQDTTHKAAAPAEHHGE